MRIFCALVKKQALPYCCLQIFHNWANYSLSSKGNEQNVHTWLHAALALIPKASTSTQDRSCCKHSPAQSKWHRSIYGNGIFAYRPTTALITSLLSPFPPLTLTTKGHRHPADGKIRVPLISAACTNSCCFSYEQSKLNILRY